MILASLFAEVDDDGDCEINEPELRKLLESLSKQEHVEWPNLTADLDVPFNLLDTDADGKINLEDFCERLSVELNESEKKDYAKTKRHRVDFREKFVEERRVVMLSAQYNNI